MERTNNEESDYKEVGAGVFGAPKNVVIDDDDNEVAGNGVTFVDDVLINAFDFVYGDGESREVLDEVEKKKPPPMPEVLKALASGLLISLADNSLPQCDCNEEGFWSIETILECQK
ncbi:unnamed protein product [Camellia sinensis]